VRKRQAFIFKKRVVEIIESYPNEEIPSEINEILELVKKNSPTDQQVRKLQAFMKARDTLVVYDMVL